MQPRRRTQRDSNPQPPVASTPLSTRALCHLRAICPVILFWATSWANHPRGGQTPFTDRGVSGFGVAQTPTVKPLPVELPGTVAPTCGRVFYGLLLEQDRVEAVESFSRRFMFAGILIVFLRTASLIGLVSSQGSHPLSAAVAAKEKELTLSRTTLLCEAWSGFDAICGVKSRS